MYAQFSLPHPLPPCRHQRGHQDDELQDGGGASRPTVMVRVAATRKCLMLDLVSHGHPDTTGKHAELSARQSRLKAAARRLLLHLCHVVCAPLSSDLQIKSFHHKTRARLAVSVWVCRTALKCGFTCSLGSLSYVPLHGYRHSSVNVHSQHCESWPQTPQTPHSPLTTPGVESSYTRHDA